MARQSAPSRPRGNHAVSGRTRICTACNEPVNNAIHVAIGDGMYWLCSACKVKLEATRSRIEGQRLDRDKVDPEFAYLQKKNVKIGMNDR